MAALASGDTGAVRKLFELGTRAWLRPGERGHEIGYLFNLSESAARPGK